MLIKQPFHSEFDIEFIPKSIINTQNLIFIAIKIDCKSSNDTDRFLLHMTIIRITYIIGKISESIKYNIYFLNMIINF